MSLKLICFSCIVTFAATVVCVSTAHAALIFHGDPNNLSTLGYPGGGTGTPGGVAAVGDPVGWMQNSNTATATLAALAVQQNTAGSDQPAVGAGPSAAAPYVLEFDGQRNLLFLDNSNSNTDLPYRSTTEFDGTPINLIFAAKIFSGAMGSREFFYFDYETTKEALTVVYDYDTGELTWNAPGGSVSTAISEDEWFIAQMKWDPSNAVNGISLSINGTEVGTSPAASLGSEVFHQYRFGEDRATSSTGLIGQMGDHYLYNDVSTDTSGIVSQLVQDYTVPEPSAMVLLGLIVGSLYAYRRLS